MALVEDSILEGQVFEDALRQYSIYFYMRLRAG